jgi:hypothetical protein
MRKSESFPSTPEQRVRRQGTIQHRDSDYVRQSRISTTGGTLRTDAVGVSGGVLGKLKVSLKVGEEHRGSSGAQRVNHGALE